MVKYQVNQDKCRRCKMCLRSRCTNLKFEGKVVIDQDKCNGCGNCYKMCPVNAIEKIIEN